MSAEVYTYYVIYQIAGDAQLDTMVVPCPKPIDTEEAIEQVAEVIADTHKTSRRVKIIDWKRLQ